MLYIPERMLDEITAVAHHFAPCGLKAIEDEVKKYCADHKIEVEMVDVKKVHGETVQVIIYHHDFDWLTQRLQQTAFEVCNPRVNFLTWEEALRFIKQRQRVAPPHLAGLPHNANEELTRAMTEWLAGKTGLELHLGDIWVHIADGTELLYDEDGKKCVTTTEGHVHLGQVTHAGSVAMHRYVETQGK